MGLILCMSSLVEAYYLSVYCSIIGVLVNHRCLPDKNLFPKYPYELPLHTLVEVHNTLYFSRPIISPDHVVHPPLQLYFCKLLVYSSSLLLEPLNIHQLNLFIPLLQVYLAALCHNVFYISYFIDMPLLLNFYFLHLLNIVSFILLMIF